MLIRLTDASQCGQIPFMLETCITTVIRIRNDSGLMFFTKFGQSTQFALVFGWAMLLGEC